MKSCLVVDDSRVVRKLIKKIMEDLSFSVEEAENGEEAIASCQENLPDVMLLDWNMPVMDGPSCLEKLHSLPGNEKVVVIFCTTETDFSRIEQAISFGANEYIMKPFDIEIIRNKLQQTGVL